MLIVSLPILVALSSVPSGNASTVVPQKADAQATKVHAPTITCPITGQQIAPCCCPAKK